MSSIVGTEATFRLAAKRNLERLERLEREIRFLAVLLSEYCFRSIAFGESFSEREIRTVFVSPLERLVRDAPTAVMSEAVESEANSR